VAGVYHVSGRRGLGGVRGLAARCTQGPGLHWRLHLVAHASGILTEWVFATVRGSPTVPRMNNDPEVILQALQQFYNGKVGPPTVNPASRRTAGTPNRSITGYPRSA
jgi:hypothetical protein